MLLTLIALPGWLAAVEVHVDTHEIPALTAWATNAAAQVTRLYPQMTGKLASTNFIPASVITLTFKTNMTGIAHRSGKASIAIAASWIQKHPDDTGMVIHEVTHIVQDYPNYNASWLVEGIADYVRFKYYEPPAKWPRFDVERASYSNGYQVCAVFLDWAEKAHDPHLVTKLNAALRENRFTPAIFKELTGHDLDELWAEFAQTPRAQWWPDAKAK